MYFIVVETRVCGRSAGNLSLRMGTLDGKTSKILPSVSQLDDAEQRLSAIEILPPMLHRHKGHVQLEDYGQPPLNGRQKRTLRGWNTDKTPPFLNRCGGAARVMLCCMLSYAVPSYAAL